MPDVFHDYARYYDLLYKEKDYAGEAAYVHGLIQKYKPGAKTILNLGCGTGKHDVCLVELGYQVTGVDLSEIMLKEAHKRSIPGQLEFFHGDVRTVSLGKTFDVVISLFHVMSYQTTEPDVAAAFKTASCHLASGGIFIFDFWNGDGVLKDPPVMRVKRLEDDKIAIVRKAQPLMHHERHVIDVNYHIEAMDKKTGRNSELHEMHVMRYFFLKELEQFLSKTGFKVKNAVEWMTDEPLSVAWYGLVVAEKKDTA